MKLKILFFLAVLFMFAQTLESQTTYEVGDGKDCTSIGVVPWESLVAGDSVKIYWRSTPYKEKWVINCDGQADKWITIIGIPNVSGALPVIDGQNATTRTQLNFWGEERGVIKIGGSNVPADGMPSYIRIQNLEIKNGRSSYSFTGRSGVTFYSSNAAGIYLEKGENIVIKNCTLTNCGNGFFAASESENVLMEGCYLFGNGNASSIYEHNSYTESKGIIFQFNHFGPLLTGASGNNLKDRSAGTIVRYNWIESGNRQLDLVDSDFPEIYELPEYHSSYVYGNILIEPNGAGNNQICHYGGDSGNELNYRKGNLFFFNNTVVSTRSGTTTLFRLSTNDETANCFNNIIYVSASGSNLAMSAGNGILNLQNNWIKEGWVDCHDVLYGAVNNLGGIVNGITPGFVDEASQDYHLIEPSGCINKGMDTPSLYPAGFEYIKHQQHKPRNISGSIDLGCFELALSTTSELTGKKDLKIYPNPAHERLYIEYSGIIRGIDIISFSGSKLLPRTSYLNRYELDLGGLERGMYIIKIITESGTVFSKLIIN